MANNKIYKFNTGVRVFNLSDGRQVFTKDGHFETTDRRLGLMIKDEYKNTVTCTEEPIEGAPKSDDDDWEDPKTDVDPVGGAGAGSNPDPQTKDLPLDKPVVPVTAPVTPAAQAKAQAKAAASKEDK